MTELTSATPDPATSLSDWETKRAEHERRSAELRPGNKTTVFDVLAAAGVTVVIVIFDGYGDSGQIENIEAKTGDDVAALPSGDVEIASAVRGEAEPDRTMMTVRDAIERLAYRKETAMGWLYMKSLKGHSGPRQYLDAQFTHERPDVISKVLRSALVGMRVYYAAVEQVRIATGQREVWAVICLVRYNPRDPEGYIFGYKDMEESMGPYECDCPKPILDLLTPTDREYAVQWRARCRENIAARRAKAAKPGPRAGQVIVFDEPLCFADDQSFQRLEVIANPRSHRTVLFRAPGSSSLYRIPNIKSRTYRLVDPPP